MESRSNGAAAAVVISLALVLSLAVGGVGVYVVMKRQLAMQAEHAGLADEGARTQAQLHGSVETEPSAVRSDSIQGAVESVLRIQQDAWNRGDIDTFMAYYWKSPSLTFSSGGKTTRGWTETRDRYRERYPTPEKMGRLEFSELEVTPLGDSAVLVLGHWRLRRESEPVSGNFSLVLRKFDDRWLIIHDHTSRLPDGGD